MQFDQTEGLRGLARAIASIQDNPKYKERSPQELVLIIRTMAQTALSLLGSTVNQEIAQAMRKIAEEGIDLEHGTVFSVDSKVHELPDGGKIETCDEVFETWEDQIQRASDIWGDLLREEVKEARNRVDELKSWMNEDLKQLGNDPRLVWLKGRVSSEVTYGRGNRCGCQRNRWR